MKTIEERAEEYIKKCLHLSVEEKEVIKEAYIKGAEKQQEIDIKNAWDLCTYNISNARGHYDTMSSRQFTKAMKQ